MCPFPNLFRILRPHGIRPRRAKGTMRRLFILLCLTACASERQPWDFYGSVEEESEVVVDGVLLVHQALPELFVRRALPLAEAVRLDCSYVFDPADIDSTGRLIRPSHSTYSRQAMGLTDARVRVLQGDQVFEYASDPAEPGRYLPPPEAPRVEALTEYRLEVEVGDKSVRASTTTPDRMRVRRAVLIDEETGEILRTLKSFAEAGEEVFTAPENELTYLEGLLEIYLETVEVEAYQAAIFALEEEPTIVDEDIEEFLDEDIDDLRANQSPPLAIRDGVVRWPWFAVAFTGRSLIKVFALDYNWFEYARTSPDQQEQGGFGGLAGENFERPFFEVEGGIGLFGSASVDSVGFVVLPRP